MIKNGVPYTCEGGEVDNKLLTFDTVDDYVKARRVEQWIRGNIFRANTVNLNYTSYSLKHLLESECGVYLTNNQFKHAMLLAGYTPSNPDDLNWSYAIQLPRDIKIDNSNPFVQWLKDFQDSECDCGDFARDVLADDDFPVFADKEFIRNYLLSYGAIPLVIEKFEELFDAYSNSCKD